MEQKHQILEVPWSTILKIAAVFFFCYIAVLIKEILILSLFGAIISILFEAPIRLLRKKISRGLAVAFLVVSVFSIITFLVYLSGPRVVAEISRFVRLLPFYIEQLSPTLSGLGIEAFKDVEHFLDSLERAVKIIGSNIFNILFSIFGGIVSTVFVVSIATILSLEGDVIESILVFLFPEKDKKFIKSLWRRCQKKVGFWFLQTTVGCLFIGVVSYIAFLVVDIDYPLFLAVIGGMFNFVPMVGGVLAVMIMFIVLALDSLPKAILAALIYIIIQQIENSIVAPLLAKRLIGISPIVVMIGLAAGAKLFGILGAVLMVPLLGVIVEFVKGFLEKTREKQITINE